MDTACECREDGILIALEFSVSLLCLIIAYNLSFSELELSPDADPLTSKSFKIEILHS